MFDWLLGRSRTPVREPARPRLPHARRASDDELPLFVCSSCGRTDLPETGDWSPPICEECDAAINFDAIEEPMLWDVELDE